MIADSGVEANCAVVVARFVARPAFCIPTSIEIVLFFAVFIMKKNSNEDYGAGLEEF